MTSILIKKSMTLALCGVMMWPAFAQARENKQPASISTNVQEGNVDFDEYVREGQNLSITYNNPTPSADPSHPLYGEQTPILDSNGAPVTDKNGNPIYEQATVKLTCDGDPLDQSGSTYTGDGGTFLGGWRIQSIEGLCYGRAIDLNNPYHIQFESRSDCNESTDLSPDSKDYCVWEGTKDGHLQITGDTNDAMMKMLKYESGGVNGFLEFHGSVAPEPYSDYRVRWLTRSSTVHADQDMMIPTRSNDYKNYMNQFYQADTSEWALHVEKACQPIQVELCINQPPIALDDFFEINEETVLTGNLLLNDYDNDHMNPDPDPIRVTRILTAPEGRQFTWKEDGTIIFEPNWNFHGTLKGVYELSDSRGAVTTATFTIKVNNLPEIQAQNDSVSVDEDRSVSFNVLSNDHNPNGYHVTLDTILRNPGSGSLNAQSNGTVTYKPNLDFHGTDSFVYRSYDQKGTYSQATVTITVRNLPEVNARNDSYSASGVRTWFGTMRSDARVNFNVLSNDSGVGLRIVGGNVPGSQSYTQSGTYRYNYTVQAYDGKRDSASVTVTVNIRQEERPESDNNSDPLIFDLDGDGIELLNRDETDVHFDLDLDGEAEELGGWVGADDGFLVLDKNLDGLINDKNELFGDSDGHAHGFDNLSSYDSDGNGLIDMGDDVYANLQIWQDANGDGVSGEGELKSLADLGIASINLGAKEVSNIINGQLESHQSTFSYDDGTQGAVSNIWFASTNDE